MSVETLKNLLFVLIPIIQINHKGKCLIGTQVKTLTVKRDQVVFNTGGGFDGLRNWIEGNSAIECLKLAKLAQDKTSQQVVSHLIDRSDPRMHSTDLN